jgi:hypothetical protein
MTGYPSKIFETQTIPLREFSVQKIKGFLLPSPFYEKIRTTICHSTNFSIGFDNLATIDIQIGSMSYRYQIRTTIIIMPPSLKKLSIEVLKYGETNIEVHFTNSLRELKFKQSIPNKKFVFRGFALEKMTELETLTLIKVKIFPDFPPSVKTLNLISTKLPLSTLVNLPKTITSLHLEYKSTRNLFGHDTLSNMDINWISYMPNVTHMFFNMGVERRSGDIYPKDITCNYPLKLTTLEYGPNIKFADIEFSYWKIFNSNLQRIIVQGKPYTLYQIIRETEKKSFCHDEHVII